eukprot:7389879-Prymnesium_polylepis.2
MSGEQASAPEPDEEDTLCIVCQDAVRAVRFHECGHSITCKLCTLKLIAHSSAMELKCPTCKGSVVRIEDWGQEQPNLSLQKTFVRGGSGGDTVAKFIEANINSAVPAEKAAANEAKQAWVPSIRLPSTRVANALPANRAARIIAGILGTALVVCWIWILIAADKASWDFEHYATSGSFDVVVAKIDGFQGPVTVLVPQGRVCEFHSHTQILCVDALAPPDRHQQWWGLIPSDQVGSVQQGTGAIRRVRTIVMYLTVFTATSAILKPLGSVYRNSPRCLTHLSSAGINAMIGSAMICGLYSLYWDASLGLVLVNYVPGWAYFWFGLWLIIVVLLVSFGFLHRNLPVILLAVISTAYWLFWLNIPLIGYSWFFVWHFVDQVRTVCRACARAARPSCLRPGASRRVRAARARITSQAVKPHAFSDTHLPTSSIDPPMAYSDKSAHALGLPFKITVYMGLLSWFVGVAGFASVSVIHMWRLRNNPIYRQQRALAADQRAAQRAAARATAVQQPAANTAAARALL